MATIRFGEKAKEHSTKQGTEIAVLKTAKYEASKKKAIEMIDSGKYDLTDADFWILMNETKSGKMMYTGLIISHNGCLKINDKLPEELKFKPSCVRENATGYRNSLVFTYNNDGQGIYEVGEVNDKNCKNEYPYAMAFKRLFDRVVLKTSKLAFSGIYSEVEADEFSVHEEPTAEKKATTEQVEMAAQCGVDIDRVIAYYNKLNGTSINAALDLPYDILNSAIIKKKAAKITAEAQEAFK